jgi:hypothetical protein
MISAGMWLSVDEPPIGALARRHAIAYQQVLARLRVHGTIGICRAVITGGGGGMPLDHVFRDLADPEACLDERAGPFHAQP